MLKVLFYWLMFKHWFVNRYSHWPYYLLSILISLTEKVALLDLILQLCLLEVSDLAEPKNLQANPSMTEPSISSTSVSILFLIKKSILTMT